MSSFFGIYVIKRAGGIFSELTIRNLKFQGQMDELNLAVFPLLLIVRKGDVVASEYLVANTPNLLDV